MEWLTFITTLILAGITLWYVILTRQMVKISQEMLNVSNTPEVRVFLTPGTRMINLSTLDLCIQNIGTGFAFDVEFSGNFESFQVEFNVETLAELDIIKNGISHLGPDKRYQIPVYYDYKPEDLPEKILTINVVYKDSTKKVHTETFHLNFRKVEDYPQIGDPSLESIARSLRSINDNLMRMINIGRRR